MFRVMDTVQDRFAGAMHTMGAFVLSTQSLGLSALVHSMLCRVSEKVPESMDRSSGLRRLLRHGADAAAKVAGTELPSISAFSEEQSPEVRDRVFEDFNSLAVVYRMPAASFIKVRMPAARYDADDGTDMVPVISSSMSRVLPHEWPATLAQLARCDPPRTVLLDLLGGCLRPACDISWACHAVSLL